MRERGVALHAFDAEMSDELTVLNGEEVCLPPPIPLAPSSAAVPRVDPLRNWRRASIAPAGPHIF